MAAPNAAVRALLASVGLQGLGAKFSAHGIDDDTLYLLDDDDLREIGIGDDTRRRILAALETSAPDDECPLCMEKSVEVRVTCSHTFCAKCLTAWRLKTQSGEETPCPTCRRPVLAVQKLPPRRPRTEAPELLRLRARAEAAEARAAALENADKARSAGVARVLQDSHRVRVSLAAAEADAAANDARALDALQRLELVRVEALRFRGELHVAVGTGKTLENYRYENDRLRQALLEAQQNEKGAEREQRRLVTENNRFRECLKHSERETKALRAMASRQQELQKAEFARHTREMQHQAADAQAKLRSVFAHVAALERECSRLRTIHASGASAPVLAPLRAGHASGASAPRVLAPIHASGASAPVLAPPGRPPVADSSVPALAPTVAPVAAESLRRDETARLLAEEDARRQAQEVAAANFVATQVEAAAVTPQAPPPQKFSNDGSFLDQMKRQLAAASRIQTAWRNRAAVADAPTPPGEPVNDLRLALEAHSELKAHEARSTTRKPLRPRN